MAMNLVVDDAEFAHAANSVAKATTRLQTLLDNYNQVMRQFAEVAVKSDTSASAVAGLVSRANTATNAMQESIDGLSSLTSDYISTLERIDGDIY